MEDVKQRTVELEYVRGATGLVLNGVVELGSDAGSDAPRCEYYAGTFERLFCGIVDRRMRVVETACEARGDPACVFEIRW